jgi:transcription-repair coupling factor (superfamily II helicase)
LLARAYGLTEVSLQGRHIRFAPVPLPDSKQLRLKRYHPDAVYKPAVEQISVPRPASRRIGGEPLGGGGALAKPTAGGELLRDTGLLEWCVGLLRDVLGEPASSRPAAA